MLPVIYLNGEWRLLGDGEGGGSGVSDHGALTGLLDNDHPQYALATSLENVITDTEALQALQALTQAVLDGAVNDIATIDSRVDSVETLTSTHTGQISDLITSVGNTQNAAISAAQAAQSEAAAIAARSAAEIARAGAEAARDSAVTAKVAAETANTGAGTSAIAAGNSATSAAAAAGEATAAAVAAEASSVSASASASLASDAAQGGVTIDAAPGALWKFDATLVGWTGSNPAPTWESGGYLRQAGGSNPVLTSPSITVDGGSYRHIAMRIRRNSGTGWQGTARYSTSGHGISDTYKVDLPAPIFITGEWMVISWDMSTLADWEASTIEQIELQLGSDGGSAEYETDWIAVGNDIASLAQAAAGNAQSAAGYATAAEAAATSAQTSATNANASAIGSAGSASAANTSSTSAAASASAAASSASAADTSRSLAQTARSGAEAARDTAVTARNDAQSAASSATTQAGLAATSALNSSNSATASANSASAAQTSATNAGTSATSATTQANNASASAGQAASSATAASTSANSAANSATASQGSATQASNSAASASGFAGQASTAAGQAANSAQTASNAAQTAQSQAVVATQQAAAANSSAASASQSASLAAQYRKDLIGVNSLRIPGDNTGWPSVLPADIAQWTVGGRNFVGMRIQTAGSVQQLSELFDLDPRGVYEVRFSFYKDSSTGYLYAGMYSETGQAVEVVENGQVIGLDANPYWFYRVPGEAPGWYDCSYYLLGSQADPALCPKGRGNGAEMPSLWYGSLYDGFRLPANQRAQLRFLNYYNTQLTSLYIANLNISRLDNQVTSAVRSEQSARAEPGSVLAQSITTAQSTADGAQSSATAALQSINGINASWTLKLDVNNRITGLIVAAGTTETEVVFLVDRFAVVTPGDIPKVPFVIGTVNGVSTVGINGNLVVDGTIVSSKIPIGATSNLNYFNDDGIISTPLNTEVSVGSFTLTTIGRPVLIDGGVRFYGPINSAIGQYIRIYRNGSLVREETYVGYTSVTGVPRHRIYYLDTPPAGTHTYEFRVYNFAQSNPLYTCNNRLFTGLELRR